MIDLRPATDKDKPFLVDLQRDAYRAVVLEQFGAWDDDFQAAHFEEKWQAQNYRIIERDGKRIGAIWTSREPNHLWLREIQIASTYRNRGTGSELIQALIDEARASGLPLRLRVLTANRAKALYERLGFRTTGMHENTHYWMEYSHSPVS
ncbi:MAG: GNAT family N-acetyltransferase [Alphaproteobacteria bacterium]|nr:GNAT family N-acetyltransferase [Alphaproteobacteria bacterium]